MDRSSWRWDRCSFLGILEELLIKISIKIKTKTH
ncbi:MAG: hypothetical protein ACI9CQ_002263, partial [Saprospiraceae bacterium]